MYTFIYPLYKRDTSKFKLQKVVSETLAGMLLQAISKDIPVALCTLHSNSGYSFPKTRLREISVAGNKMIFIQQ